MRSGSRPGPEGTRLLFAGVMVSRIMCPADGKKKDDKKGQAEDKPRSGQKQSRKKKIVDRDEVVGFVEFVFAWCFEVIRCDIA